MTTAELRHAKPGDMGFIAASWYADHWGRWGKRVVSRALYRAAQSSRIGRLLARSTCIVAFFPEVPDEILGWACIDNDKETLHYCYVKGVYRRMGVGSGLLSGRAVRWYTHPTDEAGKLFAAKLGLKYNPFHLETICA